MKEISLLLFLFLIFSVAQYYLFDYKSNYFNKEVTLIDYPIGFDIETNYVPREDIIGMLLPFVIFGFLPSLIIYTSIVASRFFHQKTLLIKSIILIFNLFFVVSMSVLLVNLDDWVSHLRGSYRDGNNSMGRAFAALDFFVLMFFVSLLANLRVLKRKEIVAQTDKNGQSII